MLNERRCPVGDATSHGEVVLEAFSQTDLNGKPIAGVGHKVSCPLCKGVKRRKRGKGVFSVQSLNVSPANH